MNPIELVPETLIPKGDTACRAYAGPSWRLSRDEGAATIRRTESEIVVESSRGPLKITTAEGGAVQVSLPGGGVYTGTLKPVGADVMFEAPTGHAVTLAAKEGRIEVSLKGFGPVVDRMGIYLKRT
jgi:hypothetical protein